MELIHHSMICISGVNVKKIRRGWNRHPSFTYNDPYPKVCTSQPFQCYMKNVIFYSFEPAFVKLKLVNKTLITFDLFT